MNLRLLVIALTSSGGTISGDEEDCGAFDPAVITGDDILGSSSCTASGSLLLERYDNISGMQ